MTKQLIIHNIQSEILVSLLLFPGKRFSELNTSKVSSDQFNFHLKKLISDGLIKKEKTGNYSLTTIGKEFANRFDTETKLIERQAKVGICVCCVKKQDGKVKYLVQQRLKEPYYGFYGLVTGKIRWGEKVLDTASRELKEETGLMGKLQLVGIEHKTDFSMSGELLEDKFFFVIKASDLRGKLVSEYDGGRSVWLTESEIFKLTDLFDDMENLISLVKKGKMQFSEISYRVKRY